MINTKISSNSENPERLGEFDRRLDETKCDETELLRTLARAESTVEIDPDMGAEPIRNDRPVLDSVLRRDDVILGA
jgi:hypothetical protein